MEIKSFSHNTFQRHAEIGKETTMHLRNLFKTCLKHSIVGLD